MIPATTPRDDPRATRMLHIDPANGEIRDSRIGALRTLLMSGDLLVVNDAATLPASLPGVDGSGAAIEARLAGERDDGTWSAVVFGAGDWRARTEDRPPPALLKVGDTLRFQRLHAKVAAVDVESRRLVRLAFDRKGADLWSALYGAGKPVQYSYAARPFALWDVQTVYSARPWAVEAPSAGFALTWDLLLDLRRNGVRLARVTHAAGLSSTGDEALDARLPLVERYEIPDETVRAIASAKARGGRVVAIGTTTTRALESSARRSGALPIAGRATTDLHLGPTSERLVVDGLVSGVHDAATSHFQLLESFAPRALLERANRFAESAGYRNHEFGDALAILPARRPSAG